MDDALLGLVKTRIDNYDPASGSIDLSQAEIHDGITDRLVSMLADLPNLTKLNLARNGIHERGVADIAKLRNLVDLDLRANYLSNAAVKYLEPLEHLAALNLSLNTISSEWAAVLAGMHTLRSLRLYKTWFGDKGCDHLSSLPSLVILNVGGNGITNRGAEQIAQCKTLTVLGIGENCLDNSGISLVSGLTELTDLDIGYNCQITSGLAALTRLKNLITLNVSGSAIDDERMGHVTSLTSLRHLVLQQNNLDDDGIRYLTTLRKLRSLDLNHNYVRKAETVVRLLRSLLFENLQPVLTTLDIQGNPLRWQKMTQVISETILGICDPSILLARLEELSVPSDRTQVFLGRIVMSGPTEHGKTHLANWLIAKTDGEKARLRKLQDRGPDNAGTWGASLLQTTLTEKEHQQPILKDIQLRVMDCGGQLGQLQSHQNLYFSSWSRTVFVLCVKSGDDFVESFGEYHLGLLTEMKRLAVSHQRATPLNYSGFMTELDLAKVPGDSDYAPIYLLMVKTHANESSGKPKLQFPTLEKLETDYPFISAIGIPAWNALKGYDLTEIQEAIGRQMAKVPGLRVELATFVTKVMTSVESSFAPDEGFERPPLKNSMSYNEFKELCDALGVRDEQERHIYVLRNLDKFGVVVAPWCHRETPSGDSCVLNPFFVQHFLYKQLLNPKPRPKHGVILAVDYECIVKGLSQLDRAALESLMRSCLVAFEIKAAQGDQLLGWFVPDLLICNPKWPTWEDVLWAAHLDVPRFLNESVYFVFIREEESHFQRVLEGGMTLYRDGCVLEDGDSRARVRIDVRKRTIDIEVRGGSQETAEDWCRALYQRFKSSTGATGLMLPGPGFIKRPPPDLDAMVAEAMQAAQRAKADKAWAEIPDKEKDLCKAILKIVKKRRKSPPTDAQVVIELKKNRESPWDRPAINRRINMLRQHGFLIRDVGSGLKLTELGALILRKP